tara:strand:- start:30 stop:314 length:285 start_codon:yes stop_codon:yes gene_type:complete
MANEKHIIDELLDEIEDPIVENFNAIGMLESLIWNSIYDNEKKKEMLEMTENLQQSEFNKMVKELKENQNITDPRKQLENMFNKGVFMDFKDQN